MELPNLPPTYQIVHAMPELYFLAGSAKDLPDASASQREWLNKGLNLLGKFEATGGLSARERTTQQEIEQALLQKT